jgi:hypothetical protein
MVDATPFLPGLSSVQGKAVVARFDGGRLSSKGGLLVLREVERRLGVADRLAACLKDPRAPDKVVHRLAEIIRFRILMRALMRLGRALVEQYCTSFRQPPKRIVVDRRHLRPGARRPAVAPVQINRRHCRRLLYIMLPP